MSHKSKEMDFSTPAYNCACTRSRIRARVNTAIPKEFDCTKKSKSSNKSRKIAHVSDHCEINLNAKQIHLSYNSPAIPERACTRPRSRAYINAAIPKESDCTKKGKSSNTSKESQKRKLAHVSDDCEINLNAKKIHLSNNSPVIPESACTRSRIRARVNTAIPKESDCKKKGKSSKKSQKRKIAHVSDDCEITLNAKQIHLSHNSPVIPECPSNYADNESIGAPSSVIIRQNDSDDDDDVIYDSTTFMIIDDEAVCDSDVIYDKTTVLISDEAIGVSSSVIIRQDDADNDDVIYDQTTVLISDSVSDHCEINLNAKQTHLRNNSPVIPERPSNFADNEAIGASSSVIICQDDSDDDDDVIICQDESGNDDVIYDSTTFVIIDDEPFEASGSETVTINDSGSEVNQTSVIAHDSGVDVSTENEASIVNDIVNEIVPGNETSAVSDIVINYASDSKSSLSNESFTDSFTETTTTICQKRCTDVSPNDVSMPSQISDVSSTSLQSINNIPSSSKTNPGCLVYRNKHFPRRPVYLKRLNENRNINVAQALSNPPPPLFNRKFLQRRQNVFPNLRINNRYNERFVRDHNNSKKRATTVSLTKAFNKDPRIPKNLYNMRAREECKELLTNTCNSKKFDTIRPAYRAHAKQSHANAFNSKCSTMRPPYGAHAKRSHPNAFNSKFSTIRPTESHDKGIHTNSLNVRNYNTVNRAKRMVIIDGSNVAFAHSSQKEFSVKGILICLDYFSQRGHEVKAVVPQVRLKHSKSTNRQLLEELNNNGKLIISPCKTLPNGYSLVSYDDRFILDLAIDHDAAIISNDNFRDLFHENAKYEKVIKSQVISFSFFKNSIWFPKDPYARSGPLLNEILRSENIIVSGR